MKKEIKWYWKNTATKIALISFWTTIMSFRHFPRLFINNWFPKHEKYYFSSMGIPVKNINEKLKVILLESEQVAFTDPLKMDYQMRIHSAARKKNLKVISFATDGIIVAPIKESWFSIFLCELFSFRIRIYTPENDNRLILSLHYGNFSMYSDFY